MSTQKEKPILMSAPMARASLDGRKTMTRRIAKVTETRPGFVTPLACHCPRSLAEHAQYCPYGRPGTKLWVRETHWQYLNRYEVAWYCADGSEPVFEHEVKKVPSIHMPRWASRITLEITAVRVERLQEISEDDARAEGFSVTEHAGMDAAFGEAIAKAWFRKLWNSINAKRGYGWDKNPFVWVISFKPVQP